MATSKVTTVRIKDLTENETFASFTSWQRNVYYILKKEATYLPFLTTSWNKVTANDDFRGLIDGEGEGALKKAEKF